MKVKIDEFIKNVQALLGEDLAHEADCFEACLKSKVASQVWEDRTFAKELEAMAAEVREAIETYAVVPTGSDRCLLA